MTDEQIKYMVYRFLGWRVPEHFRPDAGISFNPEYNVEYNAARGKPPALHQPSGTNLFDAAQAEAMVRYMVEGMPRDDVGDFLNHAEKHGLMSEEQIAAEVAAADREWFNQRLANARIHNSELERKIASQNEVIRQKSAQISRLQDTIEKLREGELESPNDGEVNP